MITYLFFQSGDLSDAITELTNAVGNSLTILFIVGIILYLIIKSYSRRSNKKK